MWYRTGTISLVINNSKVTGTGTKWADAINGVMPGMMLLGPDWKLYEIKSVESNTALTLASNYLGSTASGQAYAIITTYEGDITQFSARFSAILTSLQGSKGDLSTWLTGTGDCQITKDDGTTISVPTLAKIRGDYLSRTASAEQTVAGAVAFSKQTGLTTTSTPAFNPSSQGFWSGWNRVNTGASELINNKGSINNGGGFNFYETDGAAIKRTAALSPNGFWTVTGGLSSVGDQVIDANSTTANVLIRFRNKDSIENSAIYAQTDTGVMNIRWGGTAYVMQCREDGFISVPCGHVLAVGIQTAQSVIGKVATIGTAPFHFRGADAANFNYPNNYSIGTSNGFSVVPTVATGLAAGVEQGKPVFYVNARTGIAYALNDLYVGSDPVLKNSGTGVAMISPPQIKGITGVQYCKIAECSIGTTSLTPKGLHFVISNGRGHTTTPNFDLMNIYFSARNATTTELATGGLQVLRTGISSVSNLSCGAIYNADTKKWELWLTGTGFNSPRISIIGNVDSGLEGVVTPSSWTWTSTKPNGFVAVAEQSDWTDFNTTVDANGFIKKASPIVKLFGDGQSELNDQSQGVTTERISEGVYRVSGVFGFNGDGAWGGAGNGIEIPVDDNKRPLIWVESKVLPDGDIEIRTYHRTYDTGPYSARNIEAMDSGEVDKKKQPIFVEMPDGTPIDIPKGRFIDLRVEMPARDEPEPEFEPDPAPADEPPVSPAEPESDEGLSPNEGAGSTEEVKE